MKPDDSKEIAQFAFNLLSTNVFWSDDTIQSNEEFSRATLDQVRMRKTVKHPPAICHFRSDAANEKGKNYSREELQTGKVHLSFPGEFNDPFDCKPSFDRTAAIKAIATKLNQRLRLYGYNSQSTLENAKAFINDFDFSKNNRRLTGPLSEWTAYSEKLAVTLFSLHAIRLAQNEPLNLDISTISAQAMLEDWIDGAPNTMRAACFTSEIRSNYMWVHYANSCKGFCIVYPFPSEDTNYGSDIAYNFYPVAYSLERHDATDYVINGVLGDIDSNFEESYLNVFLSKGISWFQEKEWRLLLPSGHPAITDGSVSFPKPIGVLAGSRMDEQDFNSLKSICNEREIDCLRMVESPSSFQLLTPYDS